MQFSADLVVDGRTVAIEGSASRDAASKRITGLKLGTTVSASAGAGRRATVADSAGAAAGAVNPAAVDMLGPFAINLSGEEGGAGQPSKLSLSAAIGRSTFAIDRRNYLEGEIDLAASVTAGENKARIENLTIRQGRSNMCCTVRSGQGRSPMASPRPTASSWPATIRCRRLTARRSRPLNFAARVAGTYDPAGGHLQVSSLGIRTGSGELLAEAAVDFVAGKAARHHAGGHRARNVAQPSQAAMAVHRRPAVGGGGP